MTPFDIIAGLLLLVSGVTGWVRGASRELTSALSFIFAAAIALFGLRISGPIFRNLMDPDWAATAAAEHLEEGAEQVSQVADKAAAAEPPRAGKK